ncbi:MAG: CAP domain-containing protein [Cyanobacteria bacterium P01_G01_bin.39]
MAQPTAYEQYLLELINRARLNPLAEANLWGIDLNDGLSPGTISATAKQPLAFNSLLIDASRSHSQWMLNTDTFSHTGQGGSSAGDRIRDTGYQFSTWGENIGFTGTTGTINVNNGIKQINGGLFKSSGHRRNILSNNFREIGLGALTGEYQGYNSLMITEKFARSGSNVFLTGVAFDDLVLDDDFYTVGEGLGGLQVTAVRQSDNSFHSTTTMDSGGYQMALDAGTYDVSFYDNDQVLSTRQVSIEQQNIKLDLDTSNLPVNLAVETTQLMGEIGQISDLNHVSQTIQLNNTYTNPVVFALPLSHNGGDPAIARITDIQDDSFSLYLQEAEYLDGNHARESLSYMVLEAGTWELGDGSLLEVGTVDTKATTNSSWSAISFESEFVNKPAVLSQVQTQNGGQFVRTRQNLASADGFALAMEEEELLKNSGHAKETVGWLAIETGSGNWNGFDYQAGHTGTRIDHTWDTINFKQSFEEAPSLFASVASFRGGDPVGLRHRNLGSSSVQIELEEDQSLDSEIGHTLESVDFLAIAGSGNLSAMAYDPMVNF